MDPHSFIARAEAQRWLGIAEKLLMSQDLVGSKTFAIRARDSDPRLEAADQILAIADTLLAAEKRVVGNNGAQQPDFYAILQLVRFVQDTDHITSQYRRLAVILNPHQNRFPYSDQAFQLVNDAWAVLSNPLRKSMYDSELDFPSQQQQMNSIGFNLEQQQQHHHHQQQQQHQHNFFSINHMSSGHEQELAEPPPPPPQQTFQSRVQHSHQQQQQLQQHNFLSQPNPVRPQEQLFQHREQEQLFQPQPQPQVQPFQVTSAPPQQQQTRPSPQPPQPQLPMRQPTPPPQPQPSPPPPAAPPQPPFTWPQAPPMSQPHQSQQQQQHLPPQPQPQQQQQQHLPPQPPQPHSEPRPQLQQQLQEKQHKQQLLQEQEQQESLEHSAARIQLPSEGNGNNGVRDEELERETEATATEEEEEVDDDSPTFWTACPFCFYMYEYPKVYSDCTLRCDNCKRAFQAVRIPSLPPIIEGQEACFYCWGFFPLGVSMSHLEKNNGKRSSSKWTPFSPLYEVSSNVQNHLNGRAAPKENLFVNKSSGPRIYIDDITDDVFMGISEPSDSDDSDADWRRTRKQKVKRMKKALEPGFKMRAQVLAIRARDARNGSVENLQDAIPVQEVVGVATVPVAESSKKSVGNNPRKQSGWVGKELGKLDLNVEFNNNEGEEPAPRTTVGNRGHGQGEEDNIEGIGFFEGLDEFLSSLPILSVVNEEKVKAA